MMLEYAAILESNVAGLSQLRNHMPHDSTILQSNSHTSPQWICREYS